MPQASVSPADHAQPLAYPTRCRRARERPAARARCARSSRGRPCRRVVARRASELAVDAERRRGRASRRSRVDQAHRHAGAGAGRGRCGRPRSSRVGVRRARARRAGARLRPRVDAAAARAGRTGRSRRLRSAARSAQRGGCEGASARSATRTSQTSAITRITFIRRTSLPGVRGVTWPCPRPAYAAPAGFSPTWRDERTSPWNRRKTTFADRSAMLSDPGTQVSAENQPLSPVARTATGAHR